MNAISQKTPWYPSPGPSGHPLPSGEGFAFLFFVLVLLGFTVPLVAHHSFTAEYDIEKPRYMDGVVTIVLWQNPHVELFIDVEDKQGRKVNWDIELTSPSQLLSDGWNKDTFKPGTEVCVEGFLEKKGRLKLGSTSVQLKSTRQVVNTPPGRWAPPDLQYNGKTSCSNGG